LLSLRAFEADARRIRGRRSRATGGERCCHRVLPSRVAVEVDAVIALTSA
jgi:hypothetical protein